MRTVDRDRDAQFAQGQLRKVYTSNWLAVTLRTRLSKENLTLAHKLLDYYATAQMPVKASEQRVDCGNGHAIKQDAALDAMRRLEGYAQAVLVNAGPRCAHALRCLWEGKEMNELLLEMRLARGSYGYAVALVQRAMAAAQEYDDAITSRLTHKANYGLVPAVSPTAPGQLNR